MTFGKGGVTSWLWVLSNHSTKDTLDTAPLWPHSLGYCTRHIWNVILCLLSKFLHFNGKVQFLHFPFQVRTPSLPLLGCLPLSPVRPRVQAGYWMLLFMPWSVWCSITNLLSRLADTGCDIENFVILLKGSSTVGSNTIERIRDEKRLQGHIFQLVWEQESFTVLNHQIKINNQVSIYIKGLVIYYIQVVIWYEGIYLVWAISCLFPTLLNYLFGL